MLLGRNDIDPNAADKDGQTPLWWAAENNDEGVVGILLERSDLNPNTINTGCGLTLLSLAARVGYEEMVGMLLEQSDINQS